MEQSIRHPQQDLALCWTPASILSDDTRACPSPSLSSSVVVSMGGRNSAESHSDSVAQSSTSLKEHDYIGMAEVSSAPPLNNPSRDTGLLDLAETDLRLGFGPSIEISSDRALDSKEVGALGSSHTSDVGPHVLDDAKLPPCMSSNKWQTVPHKALADAMALSHGNGYQSPAQLSNTKNGGKRQYAEAMSDASRDPRSTMNVNSASVVFGTSESRPSANLGIPVKQSKDQEAKPLMQGSFWGAPQVPTWQPQSEPCSMPYRSIAGKKGMGFPSSAGDGNGEALHAANIDIPFRSDSTKMQPFESEENVHDDAPPAKGQVVGWPPVRSYRRSNLAMHPKLAREEGDSHPTIYVKVNMDGIPIGRKVDLNAYKSYEGLLSALEDMFHNSNGGYGGQFLKGSEFVLTYEDKEGDWMLVGDVPWSMFINTVRRLRITRGHDMAGHGSRTSACHT